MPTSPTAPSAVPDFPAIGDASYNTKAYNWATHMDATYPTEMQALATNAYNNAVEADADATTATTKAAEAVAASLAATTTANASAWVNGGTYALNANAISGVDFQTYRKKTASSVTVTDPSADGANWVQVGGSTIGTGGTTSTASITLTASSAAAMSVTPATPGLYVTLPDATTCTKADNLYAVYNAGDYDYGVKDSAGTQLGWIRARTGAMIGLADNATAAGVWVYYGLEKLGVTAQYSAPAATNTGSTMFRVDLDSDREMFFFCGTTLYAVIYNKDTGTWGTATSVRTSVKESFSAACLSATDLVLVVTCDTATAMEAVTLTTSGTGITVNTGTKAAATLAGNSYSPTKSQLIAVGSSFVFGYSRQTNVNAIRALTVSGTTPTIGSETTLSAAYPYEPLLFASGSVLRTINYTTSTIYAQPFTVSGTTLTPGTAASVSFTASQPRVFQNGNGNIVCQYVNTTVYATIFKLTGTTEAASSVSLCGAPASASVAYFDCVAISASKTLFASLLSSTASINILTDTGGTASAGTAITPAANTPTALGASSVTAAGVVTLAVSTSTVLYSFALDCSGSSPALVTQRRVSYNASASSISIPESSNVKFAVQSPLLYRLPGGVYAASGLSYGGDGCFSAGGIYRQQSVSLAGLQGIAHPTSGNINYIGVSLDSSTQGFTIQKVEAAA